MKQAKPRHWYYKIIAVAMRELNMSEEAYRDMLADFGATEKGGKVSATTMSVPQLERTLSHMKQCGFKPKRAGTTDFRTGQIAKCQAIWIALFEAGIMRQPFSEATLSKYAFRITKVNNIRWASSTALAKTIEALKATAQRERVTLEPNVNS